VNVEGVGRTTRLGEEYRECLRATQVDGAVIDLIEDRLQFRPLGVVVALPQFRHASPQLIERQKLFLIGRQQAVDALAGPRYIPVKDVPAAPPGRPFAPLPAGDRARSGSSGDAPAAGQSQTTQPSRGDPDELGGYRIPDRQDAPRRRHCIARTALCLGSADEKAGRFPMQCPRRFARTHGYAARLFLVTEDGHVQYCPV